MTSGHLRGSILPDRIVVTWSGGLDTTALIAYLAKEEERIVYPIFVNRSQSNYEREKRSTEHFISLFKRDLGMAFRDTFEVTVPIPARELKAKYKTSDADTLYALRNSDIINSAVRYALLEGIEVIAVGSLAEDPLRDDSPEYLAAKSAEIRIGSMNRVLLRAPFQDMKWNKSDAIVWAVENSIAISDSWSCWKNEEKHCGTCPACVSRKNAFREAKSKEPTVEDRTTYLA